MRDASDHDHRPVWDQVLLRTNAGQAMDIVRSDQAGTGEEAPDKQAPDLIIGVVGRLLSNDQQAAEPDRPNASATAVESTDDQMNRGRTEYRAPTRLNQAVKGAADRYLTAALPIIETPN